MDWLLCCNFCWTYHVVVGDHSIVTSGSRHLQDLAMSILALQTGIMQRRHISSGIMKDTDTCQLAGEEEAVRLCLDSP